MQIMGSGAGADWLLLLVIKYGFGPGGVGVYKGARAGTGRAGQGAPALVLAR